MDGFSLHNYTLLDKKWPPSGSATEFGIDEWYSIMDAALAMDPLIEYHSKIMYDSDPEARIGLIVDEWGTWYPVEPGTNPGFLYQQNTMRDALVAALHFDIFHKHAKRVTMTNIAQMVNVLQAMILTRGPEMVLTPTYWVFHMYKAFQGANLMKTRFETTMSNGLPAVSTTAASSESGWHIAASCIDPQQAAELEITVPESRKVVVAHVLSSETMNAHNTFEASAALEPKAFLDFKESTSSIAVKLPPMSVVVMHLQ
jgi:alpha-N-arabinofuranosidase